MYKTSSVVSLFGALGALVTSLVAVWVWAVPATVSRSSFAFVVAFVVSGIVVTLWTWRNAQATSTVAQLLHATEAGTRPRSK